MVNKNDKMKEVEDYMGPGSRLRELWEGAGLSQNKLAKLVGVTRNAVSQWENGETQPSSKRLKLLSCVLNVAIDGMLASSPHARERVIDAATRLFSLTCSPEIPPRDS